MKEKIKGVIYNIPHASTEISEVVKEDFLISDSELRKVNFLMTDLFIDDLMSRLTDRLSGVKSDHSRIVVDMERFLDDSMEVMSEKGMGAFYRSDHTGKRLRDLDSEDVDFLTKEIYDPYHKKLTNLVDESLEQNGKCLILDLHSFSSKPLPYEFDQSLERPDICLGFDEFHCPVDLVNKLKESFEKVGFSVAFNRPFSGAIVPMKYYKRDSRVTSLMVEINKKIYMNEDTFDKKPEFDQAAELINEIIIRQVKEENDE